jgi:hypothetical protein
MEPTVAPSTTTLTTATTTPFPHLWSHRAVSGRFELVSLPPSYTDLHCDLISKLELKINRAAAAKAAAAAAAAAASSSSSSFDKGMMGDDGDDDEDDGCGGGCCGGGGGGGCGGGGVGGGIMGGVSELRPALCLLCGEVVDADGKGQCTRHAMSSCGLGIGLFFLLQVSCLALWLLVVLEADLLGLFYFIFYTSCNCIHPKYNVSRF